MKRDRQPHLRQRHILNNKRIHTSVPTVHRNLPGLFQLTVIQQGIQRDIHFRIKQGGMTAETFYILYGVPCLLTGTEGGTADIYGIGTMIDGGYTHLKIFGGGQ